LPAPEHGYGKRSGLHRCFDWGLCPRPSASPEVFEAQRSTKKGGRSGPLWSFARQALKLYTARNNLACGPTRVRGGRTRPVTG
jgi:hypothetical protein